MPPNRFCTRKALQLSIELLPSFYFGLAVHTVVVTSCDACIRDFVSARAVAIKAIRFLLLYPAPLQPFDYKRFSESVGLF